MLDPGSGTPPPLLVLVRTSRLGPYGLSEHRSSESVGIFVFTVLETCE